MTDTVTLNIEGPIATITLDRPEAMNAFNLQMGRDLVTITEQVKNDDAIRAVMFRGAGKLFMAGGDIKYFHENIDTLSKTVRATIAQLNITLHNLREMPKPVLACVHGSVAGVGIGLMSSADLVIAAENTVFCMGYSNLGTSPDGGASYYLPRQIGTKRAMQLMLLSERFDGTRAEQMGLVNWAVPEADLFDRAHTLLNQMAQGPAHAYAQIKNLVNQSWQNSFDEQLELEGRAFQSCSRTSDFRDRVTAFIEMKS